MPAYGCYGYRRKDDKLYEVERGFWWTSELLELVDGYLVFIETPSEDSHAKRRAYYDDWKKLFRPGEVTRTGFDGHLRKIVPAWRAEVAVAA